MKKEILPITALITATVVLYVQGYASNFAWYGDRDTVYIISLIILFYAIAAIYWSTKRDKQV